MLKAWLIFIYVYLIVVIDTSIIILNNITGCNKFDIKFIITPLSTKKKQHHTQYIFYKLELLV